MMGWAFKVLALAGQGRNFFLSFIPPSTVLSSLSLPLSRIKKYRYLSLAFPSPRGGPPDQAPAQLPQATVRKREKGKKKRAEKKDAKTKTTFFSHLLTSFDFDFGKKKLFSATPPL